MFHFGNYCGIISVKGRVKSIQIFYRMPGLLGHIHLWIFDERMRSGTLCGLEDETLEALPVTSSNLKGEVFKALPATYGNTLAAFAMKSNKFDCHEYVQRKPVCVQPVLRNIVPAHCTRK